MTADDPLDGADVGETRTVRRSKTLHGINFEPCEFYGSDRQADIRITDLEVVEDEREGYADDVRITWEADLTKRLPRNWDRHTEPVTAGEKRQQRRKKWLGRIAQAAALAIPFGIASAIAAYTAQGLEGMTINGEPMTVPPFVELLPALLLVFGLAGLIMWTIRGGFQGRVRA